VAKAAQDFCDWEPSKESHPHSAIEFVTVESALRDAVHRLRAGKDLNQAILDGLLASSQIAIQYELAYQHAVMSSPEPDRTVAPPALEWITGYGWGDHR